MRKPSLRATNFINSALLLVIVSRTVFIFSSNLSIFTSSFDKQKVKEIYLHSQYNLENTEFYGNIDDDLLFSYAGSEYIDGHDPSIINFETPFLAKYLYGLSIEIFTNPVVIQFLFSISLLVSTIYLSKQITQSTTVSLLAAIILSFDKLFTHQTVHTLLDLPHSLFIVLSIIFFLKFLENQSQNSMRLLTSSLFIGAVASTKLFFTAAILWLVFALLIKKTKKNLLKLTLPAILIYISIFSVFFLYHSNLSDFISLHINIARLYHSYLPNYPWGQMLNIIFYGKWQTWWGEGIKHVETWSIIWPLSTIGTFLALYFSKLKSNSPIMVVSLFSIFYLLSNFFHVVFPRYVLSVLPLMIIALLYSLQEVTNAYWHRR